ncbi:hypothetical protein E2320_016236 [Naja naja]|nr:hypothetical protein E2320_016236 [Naja naja]
MPKKKGPKRAIVSEEERLLMMQQKLLAEEEMSKKKEDMLIQFLKDKLAKEERNSCVNLHKINLQWRTVLREVKARELRKDIEILSQTFERVVDCKDNVIKSLAKDLAEAEAQYTHGLRSHLHNVDQLLKLQNCRLGYLEEDYQTELQALQKEFDTERRLIIEHHDEESLYLQDVLLAMEQNFAENEYEARLDFQSTRDDVKNKDLIASMKNKIALHARESEEQNRRVRDEKEVVLKQLQKLKSQMNRARAKARNNLAKLTKESNAALKALEHVAEIILRLAEMCRRLESQEEKVLPFYSNSLNWEEQKAVDKLTLEKPAEPLAQMMLDYVGLERFWKRYNKVRLEQLSLERTKDVLMQDNFKLRHLLKQYLDGISVNDEVLSQVNPLMIINQPRVVSDGSQAAPARGSQAKRPIYNIIEAAHEVSHIL